MNLNIEKGFIGYDFFVGFVFIFFILFLLCFLIVFCFINGFVINLIFFLGDDMVFLLEGLEIKLINEFIMIFV